MQKVPIRRGFVDVKQGQVHYRTAAPAARRARTDAPPVVLIHASPGSAKSLEPLLAAFARQGRRGIAPDTLGNGDSAGAMPEVPDIAFFARVHLAALDALGLGRFDLYGTHTGASIAAEIALIAPGRVRRLILDGVGIYTPELQAELLAKYAPAITPDLQGQYLAWAWHFVRDTYTFWPWYATDAAHRRPTGLPSGPGLHAKFVEVLKAITTYHHSYRAAFRYDKARRLRRLRVPTLAACARTDMLFPMLDAFAALIPGAEKAVIDGIGGAEATEATAAIFARFLDAGAGRRAAGTKARGR